MYTIAKLLLNSLYGRFGISKFIIRENDKIDSNDRLAYTKLFKSIGITSSNILFGTFGTFGTFYQNLRVLI